MNAETGSRWGFGWLERGWQDVRYGCRMLAANPGFTLVAVLSLALGVGANTAAFSWADALLLRPLTVARPSEVVTVGSAMSIEGFSSISTSYREFIDIRDRGTSFDGLVAFSGLTSGMAATRDALPKLTLGLLVSGNFFTVMGVEPELGRNFRPEEDQAPGRDAVVILGHTLWEQQFGADPSILGRQVQLSGIDFTVVGVAPARFTGMNQFVRADFFAPLMMWPRLAGDPTARPLEDRNLRSVTIKGRLKPEVSLARAQTELSVIATDLERSYPDTNRNRGLIVRTELQTRIAQSPPDATLIAMLTTLALAVLFVACANVAGLLTSRAPARAKEMAMRVAVGAGRGRLITQLMTESLLIALAGGVLGIAVAYGAVSVFRQIQLPTDLPIALTFQLDRRALVVSLAVAVFSALLFGLAPAIQTSRADLAMIMKGGESMIGQRRRWGRNLLVGGQVAVSVVLLVLATFMYRGFLQQIKEGPGYRTDHLLMMTFDPSLVRYADDDTRRFFLQLAERARSAPGVKSVALASSVPMATDGINAANVRPEGFQLPEGKENLSLFSARVDEHYFTTLGIPIVRGRGFREEDATDAPRVAVVNEQYVQHYLPNEDPIGRRFELRDRGAVDVDRDCRSRQDDEVSLARRTADRVRLPSLPATRPVGDGAAHRIGWRPHEPRRAAPRTRPGFRSHNADLQRPHDGRVLSDADDHHLQRDHRHRLRDGHDGPRVGHCRAVRPDGVRHQPADERDRYPDGDRRRANYRPADGPAARTRARGRRARRRIVRGCRRRATVAVRISER